MARKRPAKRRKQSQKVVNYLKQDIASPVDASPSIQSPTRRSSDDDALTEDTMSDGNQTLMTSPINTDEDASADPITVNTATTSEPDTDDHDVEDDAISIYPRSHYPQVAFEHRTEEPYQGTGPRYGGSDMGASTRSLWEQDLDYRELFGRRYCRDYYMPNDDLEQLRMALIHQVFLHVLNHELTMAPLEDPKHILDVGTGTGEWAIRMAELHPTCEVVGTDISAIAETKGVPMNVFFEIEDAEEWERLPDLYDLIHFRGMEGAFEDWNLMYENVFYSLKPGGYIEIQDFDTVDGLDGFMSTFGPESVVYSLQRDLAIASEKSGRPRGISHVKPEYLTAAGFEDVNITPYDIPITVAEKTAGKIWLIACLDAFEAMCLRLLTEYMEWDPDDCKAACEEAARELANLAKDPEKSEGLAVKMVVLTARKPLDAPPAKAHPGAISSSASMQSHMDDTPVPDAPEMSRQTSPIAVESRKSREAQESLPP